VRGGAFLKPDYVVQGQDESYGVSLESSRQHRKHGAYQDTLESSQQLTRFIEPVDKYKEDADQFFAQLSNLKHGGGAAGEKPKMKKEKRSSVKQFEPGYEYERGAAPVVKEKNEKKDWSNNFNIVKETKLKVQDKVVKKDTSVTSMKVENEIQKEAKEEQAPAQQEEKKTETKEDESVQEEIKEDNNEVASKEKEKSEFEESMKINQQIAKDMHLNKEDKAPPLEVEKPKETKESTKPFASNTPCKSLSPLISLTKIFFSIGTA